MPEIPIIILRGCHRLDVKDDYRTTGNSRRPELLATCASACRRHTGRALAPDLLAASRQSELAPHRVDLVDHRLVHADLAAPLAVGLAGELVGGVEADLASRGPTPG